MSSKKKLPKFKTLEMVVNEEKTAAPEKPEDFQDLLDRNIRAFLDSFMTQGVGSLNELVETAMKDAVARHDEERAYEVYVDKQAAKKSSPKKAKAKVKKNTVKKAVKKSKKK